MMVYKCFWCQSRVLRLKTTTCMRNSRRGRKAVWLIAIKPFWGEFWNNLQVPVQESLHNLKRDCASLVSPDSRWRSQTGTRVTVREGKHFSERFQRSEKDLARLSSTIREIGFFLYFIRWHPQRESSEACEQSSSKTLVWQMKSFWYLFPIHSGKYCQLTTSILWF